LVGGGKVLGTKCPMGLPTGACGRGAGVPSPKLIREIIAIFIAKQKPAEAGF
jgi:hypothetical protein